METANEASDGRTTDTRERILDVAQGLVQQHGPNAMSYQHISEAVGIRKASIHYHFPSKNDLLVALVEKYGSEAIGMMDQVIAGKGDAAAKLRQVVATIDEVHVRDGGKACLFAMMTSEAEDPDGRLLPEVGGYVEQFEKRLATILEQGCEEGEFRFSGSARRTASVLFCFLQGAMINARLHAGKSWFPQVCQQMLALLKGM